MMPLSDTANLLIHGKTTNDSYQNMATNLGVAGKDSRMSGSLGHNNILNSNDRGSLEAIYQNEWIAKAIDIVPMDMVREWRKTLSQELSAGDHIKFKKTEMKLSLRKKVQEALKWARLYGGSAIILHVKGQGPDHTPLDPSKVTEGQLERISVVDRWQLVERTGFIEYNPLHPDFGDSEHYAVVNAPEALVHKSRIIKFHGREIPIRLRWQVRFWGDSELVRISDALVNSESVTAAIANMVQQSNIDVLKVAGLGEILMTDNGINMVKDRVELMNYTKSTANMVVLDSEEDIDRQGINFTELPNILQAFIQLISGATDIPVTRLLGSSPDGQNATGESDMENYYNLVRALQHDKLYHELARIDEVLVRSEFGKMPDDWNFEFIPLKQETTEEKTNNDLKTAQMLQILQAIGVPEKSLLLEAIDRGLIHNLDEQMVEDEYDDNPDDVQEEIDRMKKLEAAGFSQQPEPAAEAGPKAAAKNGSKGTAKPTTPVQGQKRNDTKAQR